MIPVEKCKSLIRSVSCLGRTVLPSLSGRYSYREASPVSAHLQVNIVSDGQDKRIDNIHENKEKKYDAHNDNNHNDGVHDDQ